MVGCFPDVFLLVFFLTHSLPSKTAESLLIYHRVLAFFFPSPFAKISVDREGDMHTGYLYQVLYRKILKICLIFASPNRIHFSPTLPGNYLGQSNWNATLSSEIELQQRQIMRINIFVEHTWWYICYIIKDSIARNLAQQRVYHSWHCVATVNSKKSCLYLLEGSSNNWMDRKIEGSQPPNHSFPQVWDTHLSPRLGTKSDGVRGFVRYKPILGRIVLRFWGCYGCYKPFKEGSSTLLPSHLYPRPGWEKNIPWLSPGNMWRRTHAWRWESQNPMVPGWWDDKLGTIPNLTMPPCHIFPGAKGPEDVQFEASQDGKIWKVFSSMESLTRLKHQETSVWNRHGAINQGTIGLKKMETCWTPKVDGAKINSWPKQIS